MWCSSVQLYDGKCIQVETNIIHCMNHACRRLFCIILLYFLMQRVHVYKNCLCNCICNEKIVLNINNKLFLPTYIICSCEII